MKKSLVVMIFLAVVVNMLFATPLIWRGATTIKPKQFIVQSNFYYSQTTKSYDTTQNKWDTLTTKKQVSSLNADIMVGYAPIKNLELKVLVPVASKSKDTSSSFGIGDIWLKSRYALITKEPLLFTLSGAVVLPTASKTANPPIDDRTVDIGLGIIAQTKTFGKLLGHLRFGYWLMGKTNDTTKVGDMFEYFVKLDYKISKTLTPFLTILGTQQAKTKINNQQSHGTDRNRTNLQVGTIYKASPILWIRPKISLPITSMCKGGSLAPYTIGLDFWMIK
ncbi:MAG: hypothetical protein ABIK31_00850 [candidate division WOR-3 bacterium]